MNKETNPGPSLKGWRLTLHQIIFESETFAGKAFDVALIVAILVSVLSVMLESVAGIRAVYGSQLRALEWVLTALFTIEYLLRLLSVSKPWRYATSFFGVIDLLAILPNYLSLFVIGAQNLLVIRILRVLRVFRVLKLTHYLNESFVLIKALRASRRKIEVFLVTVSTIVVILGALMYFIEGEENGFTSIPKSIYWAVVTMTTVGYGDISPKTPLGQSLASFVMILGYGILAVPTGIVTSELTRGLPKSTSSRACNQCSAEGHDDDASFCKLCGGKL